MTWPTQVMMTDLHSVLQSSFYDAPSIATAFGEELCDLISQMSSVLHT